MEEGGGGEPLQVVAGFFPQYVYLGCRPATGIRKNYCYDITWIYCMVTSEL